MEKNTKSMDASVTPLSSSVYLPETLSDQAVRRYEVSTSGTHKEVNKRIATEKGKEDQGYTHLEKVGTTKGKR